MAKRFSKQVENMWETDELLITSNSSFSHSVFKTLALETRKNQGLFGKGLIQVPLLKHVRKVVGGLRKESCVSTGVRKPGNTCASPTAMI